MADIATDPIIAEFADQLAAEFTDGPSICAGVGFSTRTFARLESRREGPPRVKVGKRILYRRAAVIEWLRSREQAQPRARRGR